MTTKIRLGSTYGLFKGVEKSKYNTFLYLFIGGLDDEFDKMAHSVKYVMVLVKDFDGLKVVRKNNDFNINLDNPSPPSVQLKIHFI